MAERAPVLHTIVCSTRPGRVGSAVGTWAHAAATAHGGFDARLLELADFALPVFDEPEHPRLGRYQHEHTKRWSASVESADAFVFVMPEYNYAPPPSWLNAMTYLVREWQYKPAAFVSYGALSGGMRSVQLAKQIMTTFKMVPMLEGVVLPWVAQKIENGRLTVPDDTDAAARAMLDELLRWARVLPALRG
jgi:NAD(P)H-dependent FMN reductase